MEEQKKIEDLTIMELKVVIFDSQQRVNKEHQMQQIFANRLEQLLQQDMKHIPKIKKEEIKDKAKVKEKK